MGGCGDIMGMEGSGAMRVMGGGGLGECGNRDLGLAGSPGLGNRTRIGYLGI